jgi:sigma-B regulation protein RsbU (phosphoserine phosphatase)
MFYKSKSSGDIQRIDSKGLLLGYDKKADYKDASMQMSSGDAVIMTTDGILECRNNSGDQFGLSKIIKIIQKENFNDSPLDILKQEIYDFNQGKFEDDVSVITVSAN